MPHLPRHADAGIAGIGHLVGELRASLAGIGGVQRDEQLARGDGTPHARGIAKVADVGVQEDEVEQRRLEGVGLGHGRVSCEVSAASRVGFGDQAGGRNDNPVGALFEEGLRGLIPVLPGGIAKSFKASGCAGTRGQQQDRRQ
ncbi:hypothetical protein [Tabrizicola sp. M-4]|uniref:hypothetical protein n=1 Tax=Tabrizicola sp. M-4 TaxID=3055847 RepID=UPI003DA99BF6